MDIHHELITPNLRTTSRVVGEKFGKLHKNVLRAVETIGKEAPEEFTRLNFEPSSYIDSTGRTLPLVEMTRDGFVLLAMGFTGAAAMEWKVRFIEAFNMMEAELAARSRPAGADLGTADGPARLGDGLTIMEKVSLVREARLAHDRAAARRMWAMVGLPDVTGRGQLAGVIVGPDEGRACLGYLLGCDAGGRTVADWVADGQDGAALNRIGLRVRDDGSFVANGTPVFAGSRWSGGQHRGALMALSGVHLAPHALRLMHRRDRGLIVPLATIAEVSDAQ